MDGKKPPPVVLQIFKCGRCHRAAQTKDDGASWHRHILQLYGENHATPGEWRDKEAVIFYGARMDDHRQWFLVRRKQPEEQLVFLASPQAVAVDTDPEDVVRMIIGKRRCDDEQRCGRRKRPKSEDCVGCVFVYADKDTLMNPVNVADGRGDWMLPGAPGEIKLFTWLHRMLLHQPDHWDDVWETGHQHEGTQCWLPLAQVREDATCYRCVVLFSNDGNVPEERHYLFSFVDLKGPPGTGNLLLAASTRALLVARNLFHYGSPRTDRGDP